MDNKFEKITTHLQTTGYIFQGSQIYGGLSNSWDYGPLGSELKNNLQQLWWLCQPCLKLLENLHKLCQKCSMIKGGALINIIYYIYSCLKKIIPHFY